MKYKDQLNNELLLADYPKRIISLVPSQTELLVELGLEENIVGVTKFCVHPKRLMSEKTIVGGTKKVNYKKINSLLPDLIIGNKEENTEEIIKQLKGTAPVYVTDIVTIKDSLQFISDIGQICHKKTESKNLINKIEKGLHEFSGFIKKRPLRKVAYFIWKKPWMVAGSKNYINEILGLNKFENIFGNAPQRYPDIYVEYFSDLNPEMKPELILLPTEPYPFSDEDIVDLKRHIDCEIKLVDGEMFSWHGSRILNALDYFKKLHLSLE